MNYQKTIKEQQAGTCQWFLEGEQFRKWKEDAASFLWLRGIPGCGKTILCSAVLHTVLEYSQESVGKAVAFFYFDFTDSRKRDPELMVCSLISQLSQQCVKIPAALEALHSSCGKGGTRPSLNAALQVLQEMILELPQTYIILDALEECANRKELMDILRCMAGWKSEKLHIFVTSREERDIENSLQDFVDRQNMVWLHSKLVDPDIEVYVRQRLSEDNRLEKWRKDTQIQNEIETALIRGAHGMEVSLSEILVKTLTPRAGFAGLPAS